VFQSENRRSDLRLGRSGRAGGCQAFHAFSHPVEQSRQERERIAIVRHFQPQATKIVGHSDLKPTTCPGIHVRALIRAGAFEPGGTDAPGPAPLRARVDEIEMDVAALYAEIEELHRKVDAP
jgi:hypothetical protein